MNEHRKLVKHWDEPGHVHELTFSCYQRQPLLLHDERPVLLSRAIDAAMSRHCCDLIAFVYMPEHVHLMVFPRLATTRISDVLFAIKRPASFRIKQSLLARGDSLVARLTIRERPGKTSFRFWQEGPGYDGCAHFSGQPE